MNGDCFFLFLIASWMFLIGFYSTKEWKIEKSKNLRSFTSLWLECFVSSMGFKVNGIIVATVFMLAVISLMENMNFHILFYGIAIQFLCSSISGLVFGCIIGSWKVVKTTMK